MLHDDDEEEEDEAEEEEPEQEEERPTRKRAAANRKDETEKEAEEGSEEDEESPTKSGRANVEIDPIVHLVENIVADKKESGQMRQYLIKYKGLSYHYAKWIPEEDFINVLSFQC